MIFPELPPVVDFRKIPWAAVPPALPACRSMLMAAALASDMGLGPGLTCEILRVPWPVSWPDTSHALNAVLADTTFRPALFAPPSAARLKTPTWSPGVEDVDVALTATPEDTVTETGKSRFCRRVARHPALTASQFCGIHKGLGSSAGVS